MKVTRTRQGWRLSQHGVVISELPIRPGPTHSVFDVLAAIVATCRQPGRIGVLGFAGGGMMAPLRALGFTGPVDTVDLDATGLALFRRHCSAWGGEVNWQHADAVVWLRQQPADFALLLDDLSVSVAGDVIKPRVSWAELPPVIWRRLRRDGVAVFNLLPPVPGSWAVQCARLSAGARMAHVIELAEFENRILVAGNNLPSARAFGASLRRLLRGLGSRQAEQLHVRRLR